MFKSLVERLFKATVVVSLGFILSGCAGSTVVSATKFTSYEDFRPGPEGGRSRLGESRLARCYSFERENG